MTKKKKNSKALELNRIKCKKINIWGGMASYYKENGEDVCIYEKVIVPWFSRYNTVEKIHQQQKKNLTATKKTRNEKPDKHYQLWK